MTRDKLIFSLFITQILCHFSISYSESTHFSPICAIDVATVRRNEAQPRPKWPQTKMATSPTSSTPSTSVPSSSPGGVTFKAVMVQLQGMDARLDTLSDELCQVNTSVNRIAGRQARLGSFVVSPFPSLEASEDEDGDGDFNDDDDDEDEDASSSDDDMMIA